MKALDILNQYYDIGINEGNIILNKKNELPEEKGDIIKAIATLKKYKKCAIDTILYPSINYKKTVAVTGSDYRST